MPLRVRCNDCGKQYSVPETRRGSTISCRSCGEPIKVGGGRSRKSSSAGNRRSGNRSSKKRRQQQRPGWVIPVFAGGTALLVAAAALGFFLSQQGDDEADAQVAATEVKPTADDPASANPKVAQANGNTPPTAVPAGNGTPPVTNPPAANGTSAAKASTSTNGTTRTPAASNNSANTTKTPTTPATSPTTAAAGGTTPTPPVPPIQPGTPPKVDEIAALRVLKGHKNGVNAHAWSGTSDLLATAGGDSVVRLWNPQTGAEIRQLQGHEKSVLTVDLSADGAFAVTCGSDRTLRVWDAKTGKELWQKPFDRGYYASAISPDGKYVAAALGYRKPLTLWDRKSQKKVRELGTAKSGIKVIDFSPDGQQLFTAERLSEKVWNVKSGKELFAFDKALSNTKAGGFSANGEWLMAIGRDNMVRFWDTKLFRPLVNTLVGEPGAMSIEERNRQRSIIAATSPAGRALIAADSPVTVIKPTVKPAPESLSIWDSLTKQKMGSLRGHGTRVNTVSFSPNGLLAVATAADSTVTLWDVSQLMQRIDAAPKTEIRDKNGILPSTKDVVGVAEMTPKPLVGLPLPVYLHGAVVHTADKETTLPYAPHKKTGEITSHDLTYKVFRSQPLFLQIDWSIYEGKPEDVLISQQDYLEKTRDLGWRDTGFDGWGPQQKLYVRYCRAGETPRLPSARDFPAFPKLIAPPLESALKFEESDSLPESAQRFALAGRASRMLFNYQFEELDQYLQSLAAADKKQKSKNGVSRLAAACGGMIALGPAPTDEQWIANRSWFENWQKQRPQSQFAKLCLGFSYLEAGWRARGTGYSSTVSPEAFAKLKQHATRAKRFFEQVEQDNPGGAAVYSGLIQCIQALGKDNDAVRQYLKLGLAQEPTDWKIVQSAVIYFSPKWYGSRQEIRELAETTVELTKAECGEMHYATIAYSLTSWGPYSALNTYEFDWNRIKQGFADYRRLFPAARQLHRRYWILACAANDKPEAQLCFDEIGPEYDGDVRRVGFNAYLDWRDSIFSTPPKAQLARVIAHDVHLPDVQYTPDGQQIATGGRDRTVRIWDQLPTDAKQTTTVGGGGTFGLKFLTDSKQLIVRTVLDSLWTVNPQDGTVTSRMPSLFSDNWFHGEFSRDGKRLAAIVEGGHVGVWDLETRKTVGVFQKAVRSHYANMSRIAISPAGDAVSWASGMKEVAIVNIATGQPRSKFKLNDKGIRVVAFSPDGKLFAAVGEGQFGVWNAKSGQQIATHTVVGLSPRNRLRFSPDGKRLAFDVEDYRGRLLRRSAGIWDYQSQPQKIVVLPRVRSEIYNLAWSPDNQNLATVGADLCLRVWDVAELMK